MSKEKKYYFHGSNYIDENVEILEGTKIWHFSHVQTGAKIGKNCSIGQNVNIGNDVKIQNNVSIYEGVEIEDYVLQSVCKGGNQVSFAIMEKERQLNPNYITD